MLRSSKDNNHQDENRKIAGGSETVNIEKNGLGKKESFKGWLGGHFEKIKGL